MPRRPFDADEVFAVKRAKPVPFEFVLDALAPLSPWTRPMFGCTAVYVGEKIVLVLRDKDDDDGGVWVAMEREHHASMRKDFPVLRNIEIFGTGDSKWQVIARSEPSFESTALRVCALLRAGDARIGCVPKPRKSRSKKAPGSGRGPRGSRS